MACGNDGLRPRIAITATRRRAQEWHRGNDGLRPMAITPPVAPQNMAPCGNSMDRLPTAVFPHLLTPFRPPASRACWPRLGAACVMLTTLRLHTKWVSCVAFPARASSRGEWLGRRHRDAGGLATGRLGATLRGHGTRLCVSFAPGAQILASASADRSVGLWDVGGGTLLALWSTARRCSPSNSRRPAGVLASGGADGRVLIYDVVPAGGHARVRHDLSLHEGAVWSLAFAPDSAEVLASAGADKSVIIWNAVAGKVTHTLRGHSDTVFCVAFSPSVQNGRRMLASGGADKQVIVWDAVAGTVAHVLNAHTAAVRSVAFAPTSENMLVSGGDDLEMRLWDARARTATRTLHGHPTAVNSVAWSTGLDGDAVLASGGADGSVIVWAPLERKTGRRSAAVRRRAQPSPAHRSVTTGSSSELCLICLDRKRSSRLRPCLHVVACETCVLGLIARGEGRCPTCRARIKEFDVGQFNVDDPSAARPNSAICGEFGARRLSAFTGGAAAAAASASFQSRAAQLARSGSTGPSPTP